MTTTESAPRPRNAACALLAAAPGGQSLAGGDYKLSTSVVAGRAPGARAGAAAVYDSKRDRVLVFGGRDAEKKTGPTPLMALELGDERWLPIETHGPSPQAMFHPAMAYDAKRDRLVLYGGWAQGESGPSPDLWILPLADGEDLQWRKITPSGAKPSGRNGTSLCVDAARDRLILFGGDAGPHPQFGFTPLNDLWALNLADLKWDRLDSTGDVPEPRWNLAAAVVPQWELFIVFGGAGYVDGRAGADSDVYVLKLRSLRWSKRPARGPAPMPLEGTSITLDERANALVVAGGLALTGTDEAGPKFVWLFDLMTETWTKATPKTGFPRRDHVGVYASKSGEHVIFGGEVPQTVGNFYERGEVLNEAIRLRVRSE